MNSEYSKLINKIKVTGDYIDRLARIESDMKEAGCNGLIDNKAIDSLEKCIDDINKIYIDTGGYINRDTDNEVDWLKREKITIAYMQEQCDKKDDKIKELEDEVQSYDIEMDGVVKNNREHIRKYLNNWEKNKTI